MFKKQNPEPPPPPTDPIETRGSDAPVPVVPPFRTFVIKPCALYELDESSWRVIDNVHGYEISDHGLAVFIILFLHDGHMLQANRYAFKLSPGDEIEEINAAFGEPVKH